MLTAEPENRTVYKTNAIALGRPKNPTRRYAPPSPCFARGGISAALRLPKSYVHTIAAKAVTQLAAQRSAKFEYLFGGTFGPGFRRDDEHAG